MASPLLESPYPLPEPVLSQLADLARGRFARVVDACHETDSSLDCLLLRAIALERLGDLAEASRATKLLIGACGGTGELAAVALVVSSAVEAQSEQRMGALDSLRRARRLAPDWAVPQHLIDSLGGGAFVAPQRNEVVALFDRYAPNFDSHLLGDLAYTGHERLAGALIEDHGKVLSSGVVLDLGCGTGLCGRLLRPTAECLVGVDVSPAILSEAESTGIYDALFQADLVYALATTPARSVAALAAADVLGYVGPLEALFQEAARVLSADGVFGFTLERAETGTFELGPSRRCRYSRAYLDDVIQGAGLELVTRDEVVLRREQGQEVIGYCVVVGTGSRTLG